jgi:hypothetical protein
MSYFNQKWQTEIVADASPVGLGAILAQANPSNIEERKIVSYASRLLHDTERRYSQIEKEALAAVWACERFHLYIFARKFDLVTDNKAVEMILKNPRSNPPLRIQRWNLRLGQYNFIIKHRPGQNNPSDYLSRHPTSEEPVPSPADEYVNMIENESMPPTISKEEIINETKKDQILQQVMMNKEPYEKSKEMKAFELIKDQISISQNGLILKEQKIVVPNTMQSRVVSISHEGHQGSTRMKQLLRERVWFPNLNKAVEELVSNCPACQATTIPRTHGEVITSELPTQPWQIVSLDFFGPFENSIYLMHICNEFSRYPFVEEVKSTSAEAVIPVLSRIFAMFGTPNTVKSDNGLPFNGENFAKFSRHLGFKHRKVTPLWPRANGCNERFMQSIKKVITTAIIEKKKKKKWRIELTNFLKAYRATPHYTTG